MNRFNCPCCGYPTLEERRGWEICCLCDWEDDGQDDPHADEVWGGPNADYALMEARNNFKKNYTMYGDKRNILRQSEKEILTKKALIIEFDKLKTITNEEGKLFIRNDGTPDGCIGFTWREKALIQSLEP